MKKVLHIPNYYSPHIGGIEQTAKDFVESIADRFEQKVICFNDKNINSIEIINGIEVHRCSIIKKISSQPISFSYGKQLKKLINNFNPDIIVFHYPNPLVAIYLLKYIKKDCKLIVYWHLDIVKQKILRKLFYFQNKKILRRAYKIIATSPIYIDGSKWLSSVRDKCLVIPSCIHEDRLNITNKEKDLAKKIRKENNNKIICLAIGRHTEYKGTKYLIEASKYLDDNYVINIIGQGDLTNSLKEMAKDDNKIHFLGQVNDETLLSNLLACDIYCFPSISKNEAFGLSLAEAMYFEKPTVTFTIHGSGVNYVSLNKKTGIEVENSNSKEFANAIKKLGSNEKLREQYGNAAKERVLNNFTLKQYKKNVLDFMLKV